jgi:hypothetical protein
MLPKPIQKHFEGANGQVFDCIKRKNLSAHERHLQMNVKKGY